MPALEIMELLFLDTGKMYYQVLENDNWKFPALATFRTMEEAEAFIRRKNG